MAKDNSKLDKNFSIWISDKDEINNYKPDYHFHPNRGILTSPNSLFFYNDYLFCFFHHIPLKSVTYSNVYSLVKTKDFVDYNYHLMVNKPDYSFEKNGVFPGSVFIKNGTIYGLHIGKEQLENQIVSTIVKSEFDLDLNEFISKEKILNNLKFENYYTDFISPYLFEYQNTFYFFVGSKKNNGTASILLFSLDNNFSSPKLIKEILLSQSFSDIKNISFMVLENSNSGYLFYSAKYSKDATNIKDNVNPVVCWYSKINLEELFDVSEVEYQIYNSEKIDYGIDFNSPYIFKNDNRYFLVGLVGSSENRNYYEKKFEWMNLISLVKEIKVDNDENLIFVELKKYKNLFENSDNKFVKYFSFEMIDNESVEIYDQDKKLLSISIEKTDVLIQMFNDNDFHQFSNDAKINGVFKNDIEIFIDNSIIEIKVNNNVWYTSRIYFDKKIALKYNKSLTNYENKYIFYDVSAFFINWFVFTDKFVVIKKGKIPISVNKKNLQVDLVKLIGEHIRITENKLENIIGVGVTISDLLNSFEFKNNGINSPMFFEDFNFENELSLYTNLPIISENKINYLAIGLQLKGNLVDNNTAVVLNLDNYIQGCVLLNRLIYQPSKKVKIDLGSMDVLNKNFGTWFSLQGLSIKVLEEQRIKISPEVIFKNVDNQFSNEIAYWYQGLARGVVNIIAAYNPEKIIIDSSLNDLGLIDINLIKKIKDKILSNCYLETKTEIDFVLNSYLFVWYGFIEFLKSNKK